MNETGKQQLRPSVKNAPDENRWDAVVKKPAPRASSRRADWVRDPSDYPDFPPHAVRKWAGWNRQKARYCSAWYRFLCGETDEPPRPSQVVGSRHLKVAQREWRKRNGISEPTPVIRMNSKEQVR